MNAEVKAAPAKTHNGLTALTPGLPATAYYEPAQYELELAKIWYRNWNYVDMGQSMVLAVGDGLQAAATQM